MKMQTVHKTTIVGACPHDCPDVYQAEFHVNGTAVLAVEAIQAAIDSLTGIPLYQEELTSRLAERLGCVVETTGPHGKFVTTCRAEPGVPPQ